MKKPKPHKGNRHKAKSSAMGINMGRTGPPTMGASAPWGGQQPPMQMPNGPPC